jgi:hypothetical protein
LVAIDNSGTLGDRANRYWKQQDMCGRIITQLNIWSGKTHLERAAIHPGIIFSEPE